MGTVFNRLGPYQIHHEIGRGGMAVVFLATDTRGPRRVALKLVPTGTDREAREILAAEQLGAELQQQFCRMSRYVPAVYAHAIDSGYFFIAMEYLDGENLSHVITRGPLPVERATFIATELCRFLEDADRFETNIGERPVHMLLHGDLKPRNVRITRAGQIKVLDFGIAKALSLSRKVTRNDFGSVAYLSPERLDTGDMDRYADFWAVGVLLHEMLSGTPPFQAPDTRRLEQLILSRRPPPPLPDTCPPPLRAVVAKLLGADPSMRYESARAIREELERVTAGAKTRAEEEGWLTRVDDEQATRRTRPAPDADEEATRRTAKPDAITPPTMPPPIPVATAGMAPAARAVVPPPLIASAPPPNDAPPPVAAGPPLNASPPPIASGAPPNASPPAAASGLPLHAPPPAPASGLSLHAAAHPLSSGLPLNVPPPAIAGSRAIAAPPRKRRRLLRYAVVAIALAVIGHEMSVSSAADRIAAFVPTRGLTELADVWTQYDDLAARSYLGMGARRLERALTRQTAALADAVIGNYRSPSPSVRESQWRLAREALARAIAVSPDNRELRAALRYCDGHIHRINGEARKSRRQTAAAQQEFTAAVAAFREAAELRPKWPDPFLGLARTFIYGLEDVDRAADALRQAQGHGYTPAQRETVQLADGYRARADTLVRNARQLDGMPQQRDYLARAINAYRQALTLYSDAVDFANVPRYVRLTQRSLERVEQRLNELDRVTGKGPESSHLGVPRAAPAPLTSVPESSQ